MRQCSRAVDSVRVSLGHVWPLAGCCVLLVVLPAQARAQQSEADDASWALFTGHRYREALHRAGSADAYLRALACMRLGMLYSELGEITTPLAGDYLRVLQALGEREDRHTARSAYTPYYLSLVLRKLGRNERAADLLEAFLGDPIVESSMLIGFATCELGACLHAMGREDEADRQFDAAFALAEGDLHIAAYLALLCLRIGARQEQADMLISRVTRSPEEWSGGSPYSALRLSVLLSARNEHEAALSLLDSAYKRPWRPTPETVDTPEPLQRMEFFPAAMFELVAEVYLRAALDVFSRLRDDDFAYDIQFARALTLYMVGDHVDAAAILVTMRADAALPSEMAPSVAVLLGRCYVKQGRATDARALWNDASDDGPNAGVDVAYARAAAGLEPREAALLLARAMDQLQSPNGGAPATAGVPELYAPLGAYDPREIYRRAGKAALLLREYAEAAVDVVDLGLQQEQELIDYAVLLFRLGRNARYPHAIDEPQFGNDPLLLVDVGYTAYERGFDHWGETAELYGIIQRDLPEIYPLHMMVQVIYTIQLNLHEDLRGR